MQAGLSHGKESGCDVYDEDADVRSAPQAALSLSSYNVFFIQSLICLL